MAEVNTAATTTPKITAGTELWYAKKATPTSLEQIFMVQEIPKLESAPEPKTYSSLESAEEFSTPGKKKSETIEIPLLYVEEQHDELKALSDSKEQLIFYVKLPDSTAAEKGKPLTYTFPGTIHLANDSFADDDMIKESITIYKNGKVEEIKGLPKSA